MAEDKNGNDDSKVRAAVVGVGVGLAAALTAPLVAGVALSAIGFTSSGVAAGSMAASLQASGGNLFYNLRSSSEQGISGTVAAGLGIAAGAAAAALTAMFSRRVKRIDQAQEPSEAESEADEEAEEPIVIGEVTVQQKASPAQMTKNEKALDDTPAVSAPSAEDMVAIEQQIVNAVLEALEGQIEEEAEFRDDHSPKPSSFQDQVRLAKQVDENVVEETVQSRPSEEPVEEISEIEDETVSAPAVETDVQESGKVEETGITELEHDVQQEDGARSVVSIRTEETITASKPTIDVPEVSEVVNDAHQELEVPVLEVANTESETEVVEPVTDAPSENVILVAAELEKAAEDPEILEPLNEARETVKEEEESEILSSQTAEAVGLEQHVKGEGDVSLISETSLMTNDESIEVLELVNEASTGHVITETIPAMVAEQEEEDEELEAAEMIQTPEEEAKLPEELGELESPAVEMIQSPDEEVAVASVLEQTAAASDLEVVSVPGQEESIVIVETIPAATPTLNGDTHGEVETEPGQTGVPETVVIEPVVAAAVPEEIDDGVGEEVEEEDEEEDESVNGSVAASLSADKVAANSDTTAMSPENPQPNASSDELSVKVAIQPKTVAATPAAEDGSEVPEAKPATAGVVPIATPSATVQELEEFSWPSDEQIEKEIR